MTRDNAAIEFDSRLEVREILRILSAYMDEHPAERKNDDLRSFYQLLDIMDVEW